MSTEMAKRRGLPKEELRTRLGAETDVIGKALTIDGRPYTVSGVLPPDHRTVLGGILWVVRSGASWRAMPAEYGKWETTYQRYRLWCATGLWQCILEALSEGH